MYKVTERVHVFKSIEAEDDSIILNPGDIIIFTGKVSCGECSAKCLQSFYSLTHNQIL